MDEKNNGDEKERLRSHAAIGRVVTGVVHESRNILTGALSFAQVGKRKTGEPEAKELFTRIERELFRVLEIFNHTLDVARGRTSGAPVGAVDVQPALRSVRALIREQARLADVKVIFATPDHIPAVLAHERYVVQILLNLCINALHASPPGATVRVSVTDDGDAIDVRVSDGGKGVPRDSREKIFEPFYTTKGEAGSGLGLSASREMAQEIGGDLSLVTSGDGGATFSLRLKKANA